MEVVIGVAGAGKTTYLTKRYGALPYSKYIFTSLTNASIKSFLFKMGLESKIHSIRTIYGLAYKELDRNNLLDDNKKQYLKNHDDILLKYLNKFNLFKYLTIEDIQNVITYLTLDAMESGLDFSSILRDIYYSIEKILIKSVPVKRVFNMFEKIIWDYYNNRFYTFPFLLYESYIKNLDIFKVFIEDSVLEPQYILLDEFQDVPKIIYKYILQLNKINKCVLAGDPAQEIFTFLRTDSRWTLSLAEDYKYLTVTYRFGESICGLANYILKEAGFHYRLKTKANHNTLIIDVDYSRANLFTFLNRLHQKFKEVAILVRTRELANQIEKILSDKGYRVINLEKVDYSKLSYYIRKIKEEVKQSNTLDKYLNYKESILKNINKIAPSKYREYVIDILTKNTVYVSTIHNVKGLEFDSVIFIDDIPKKIKIMLEKGEMDFKEELKVLYVAVTRAKYSLILMKTVDGYFSYI